MDSGKINDWLQIVGLFGVIASLVFVGLQLKQSQDIARSTAQQTRAWGAVELQVARASNPQLISAQKKLWGGKGRSDDLLPEEIIALYWDHLAFIKTTEDNYFQYKSGFIDESRWTTNMEEIRCIYSSPFYRKLGVVPNVRKSFREILSEIYREADNEPINCFEYEPGSIWDWEEEISETPLDK